MQKEVGVITVSTTISRSLWDKAHNKVKWSEALRIGVCQILSDAGDPDFINPMQQQRKIDALVTRLEEFAQEKERLEEEIKAMRGGL